MRSIFLVGIPRAFGSMVLVAVLLGAINMVTGWRLALRIGGSSIAPIEDGAGLVVLGLLGLLSLGLAEAVERDLFGALRRAGPKAWILTAAVAIGLPWASLSTLERLSYEDRAEWAAATGNLAVVQEELEASPEPAALAARLLKTVAQPDQAAVAAVLLAAGADPNTREAEGLPALGRAVLQGAVGVTEVLLAHGADPNLPDSHGATPLLVAAGYGNADEDTRLRLVELLLAKGADPRRKNRFDTDAITQARRDGRARVAARLEAHATPAP